MKHLSILVPLGDNNVSSIAGAYKIFTRANLIWQQRYRADKLKIELVGFKAKLSYMDGLFTIRSHKLLTQIRKTDLIVIPSLNHNYIEAIEKNKQLIAWLVSQHSKGAEIASICTGAFLLAETGIINSQSCSTHWSAVNDFKSRYPEINLRSDQTITDENGIYTNGGAYSFLNLVIYLIEKYFDRPTALMCSKIFQVEYDRNLQSEFVVFNGYKKHGDRLVQEIQTFLEKNYEEPIFMEKLANKFCISRRSFDRRFIAAIGLTPLEYLQKVRVESAKKQFELSDKSVSEVMYESGYSDPKAFRDMFQKHTGLSPIAYKDKYGRKSIKL